jgi:hypothetical protein
MSLVNLKNRSREVRNETQFKANTASRVGQILMDIVDYLTDLFTDKHNHTNKAVLDELGDSGDKLTYKGLIIEGSSNVAISTWINPPVIKIVAALPSSGNTEGDRYILQGTGRIYTYTSGSWVLDPATTPDPSEGSAVIVRYDGDDNLVNAIHVYESGTWVDKSSDFSFDDSLFTTKYDTSQGRQNIPITGSPNDISQTGFYFGSDNVSGSPLYDVGGGLFTDIITYKHESYDEDNAYQSAQSFGDVTRWFRRKKAGVWGAWAELTTKAYVDSVVTGAIILQGAWNASTNTPDITGTTVKGYAWRVSVAGSTDLGGITDWRVGDLAIKVATGWLKVDNEDISAIWGNITGVITDQTDLIGIIFWEADGGSHVQPKSSKTVKILHIDPTALVDKTTPIDADYLSLWDTVAVAWKKLTWANIKATLKTVNDLLYIAKTTNVTAINDTGIADGEIAVFNLTNKDIRTSDKTLVTTLGTDDTTVPTSKAVKDVADTKVIAPATNTADYVPQWNGANSKTLKNGKEVSELELVIQERIDNTTAAEAGGTTTGLTNTTATDSTKTWTVNEHAGKFAIIEYTTETQFTPVLKEAIKILSNTATALTFNKDRKYKAYASASAYKFITPVVLAATDENTISCYVETRDSVVELPATTALTNGNSMYIYNEFQAPTTNNFRTWIYALGSDTIYGTDHLELPKQREAVWLKQHYTAVPHWDVFLNDMCIKTHVELATAAAAFSANNTYVPVPFSAVSYNKPCGFLIEETDTAGVLTFTCQYTDTLTRLVSLEAIATIGGVAGGAAKNFYMEIQKYNTGTTAWDKISNVAGGATSATITEITLICSRLLEASELDLFRVVVKCEDNTTFQVLDFAFNGMKI